MAKVRRPCLFLDRDGVINEDTGWIASPEELRVYPGAAEAIRVVRERGWLVVVVTNQSVVARGLCDAETMRAIHESMRQQLRGGGAEIDALYWCPHHPDLTGLCGCRKPATGMIDRATTDLGINLAQSWLVGDKTSDILTGHRAGLRTVLVRTGKGGADRLYAVRPDFVEANLLSAVQRILGAQVVEPGEWREAV